MASGSVLASRAEGEGSQTPVTAAVFSWSSMHFRRRCHLSRPTTRISFASRCRLLEFDLAMGSFGGGGTEVAGPFDED
jgi:hypothetical protein